LLLPHGRLFALVLTWLADLDKDCICCCFPSHPGICAQVR
jgi:hypothetical protein